MLTRRILRIKCLQSLYAFFQTPNDNMAVAEKNLYKSIENIHDLYIYQLALLKALHYQSVQQMEEGKQKKLPTPQDLSPNTKFVDGQLINIIVNSEELTEFEDKRKINWLQHRQELKKILQQVKTLDTYQTYVANESYNLNDEKNLLISIVNEVLNENELLDSFYDEVNFNWINELEFVNMMVVKTIKQCKAEEKLNILPIYKDQDDKDFVGLLFRKPIVKSDEYDKLIREKAKNWEFERIALIDVIMMKMAITEFIEFDSVPVKVSLNEYIELSKAFSTPKSKTFINGILDRIVVEMKADGQIIKRGRGLLE